MRGKIITFVIGEVSRARGGEAAPGVMAKSAPPYAEKAVPRQFVSSQTEIEFEGRKAQLLVKAYKPDTLLAELVFEVSNMFAADVLDLKEKAIDLCIDTLKKRGGKNVDAFSEEYALYIIPEHKGNPEELLAEHKEAVASLLKSERVELDPHEVDYTISSQLKYEKDDLVIIDWDGAFIMYATGGYDETLNIIELANLQLLRSRLLDKDLDDRLRHAVKLVRTAPPGGSFTKARALRGAFQEIIAVRAESIAEFEILEREVKLIGDWYLARLYDVATKKFKLDTWRNNIQNKLESLEDIYSIASENLGMSRTQVLELIQILAFFVLQIGWFLLIILEFFYFTK